VVVALAVAVTPAVVLHRPHRAADTTATADAKFGGIEVWIPTTNASQVSQQLQKRFASAGIAVRSVSIDPNHPGSLIEFQLGADLSSERTQDELAQLTSPGSMQFRTVLASMAMPALTSLDVDNATRQPATPPTLASVQAELGSAYAYAAALTQPATLDAATRAKLAPFTTLTSTEVAVLPVSIQYNVPIINCAQIVDPEPVPPAVAVSDHEMVTCNGQQVSGRQTKYLLSPARVTNAGIASATPDNDPVSGWGLTVRFTSAGRQQWASFADGQVAVVTDATILTVIRVHAPVGATMTFTVSDADFAVADATTLALVIDAGPLATSTVGLAFRLALPHSPHPAAS
jgi:hypothetical protein